MTIRIKTIYRLLLAVLSFSVLAACSSGSGDTSDAPPDTSTNPNPPVVNSAAKIEALFLAQTHVLSPDHELFKMVSNRDALLKVQVLDSGGGPSPTVTVDVQLDGESTRLELEGPDNLPTTFDSALGSVNHQFDDSFTVVIPAQWVQPGLSLQVNAGSDSRTVDIKVGAPNAVKMDMFDVHYFGQGDRDYPEGTFAELQSKWPVSSLSVERIRDIDFLEMVIPARSAVGTPHVRITSTAEYRDKTGLNFDGEQAAALQWVHALSAAGGNQDTVMNYINIIGVNAGGQAGGFDGVGAVSVGILNHELGHALSLPHWGNSATYPYKGDMHGISAPDVFNATHIGPAWAFDLPTMTFIPPTVQTTNGRWIEGTYKASPMQGGGTGDQEPEFLMRHFSDYGVNQMRNYLESKVAVKRNDGWFKWNDTDGDYTNEITSQLGIRYPIEIDVEVVSVMAATSLADMDLNMVYSPIGPYQGNLIERFDPTVADDRTQAAAQFCPTQGCDFSLRITQGDTSKVYMLPASGIPNIDAFNRDALKTAAINVPLRDGEVTRVELLMTPDAQVNGLPSTPQVLDVYQKETGTANQFTWNPPVQKCTNTSIGPVKVFLLAGQSNMQGHGEVSASQSQLDKNGGQGTLDYLLADNQYIHLQDNNGDWIDRDDVWMVYGDKKGKLTTGFGANNQTIGPELEFGNHMGDLYDNQVLIIKTAWGGTSLAADWRPPSSGEALGPRYSEMFTDAQEVLSNLANNLPNYQGQGFEIAGFAWHQGWNDRVNQGFNDQYQTNMVNFVNDVRNKLENQTLPFVIGTTGMGGWDETHPRALSLMNAQLAVPNDNRLNNGSVNAVETRDYWRTNDNSPANQNYHWNRNAETYLLIGRNMAESLQSMICQ